MIIFYCTTYSVLFILQKYLLLTTTHSNETSEVIEEKSNPVLGLYFLLRITDITNSRSITP